MDINSTDTPDEQVAAVHRLLEKHRLLEDGVYHRRAVEPGDSPFRAQQHLQDEARRRALLVRDGAGLRLQPASRRPARSGPKGR